MQRWQEWVQRVENPNGDEGRRWYTAKRDHFLTAGQDNMSSCIQATGSEKKKNNL